MPKESKSKIIKSHNCLPDGDGVVSPGPKGRADQSRFDALARPTPRRLRALWHEMRSVLPPRRLDKLKSVLEEEYFMSPEQTEEYFQAVRSQQALERRTAAAASARRERDSRQRELRLRQRWLVEFSAQVAFRLCDYLANGPKEMIVSNRLRAIADVVLERVAEILGEPKPSRLNSGRLARFMVAVSDRVAVWIENTLYKAEADAAMEGTHASDDHLNPDGNPMLART